MTKQDREKQVRIRKRVLSAGAAAAALAFVFAFRFVPSREHMDGSAYFGISETGVGISIDGEPSGTAGILIGDEPFVDYESAAKLNPSVFYDEKEEKLIVTTPTEKVVREIPDGGAPDREVVKEGETICLSTDFLGSVTDASIEVFSDPARVVMRTKRSYVTEQLKGDAPMRYRAGRRSPILADLSEGSRVEVTDVASDGSGSEHKVRGWTRVVTEDGYAGYVEDRFLTDPEEETRSFENPVGEYTKTRLGETVNLVFHQVTDQASNQALSQSLDGVSGINVIAPTWFFLDTEQGDITSLASSSYVETAHAAGLSVWAVLNDFDGQIASAASTEAALSSDSTRTRIVEGVTQGLIGSGADGLVVDMELIRADSAPMYLELIRELSAVCRREGIVLSVCNYVPTFTGYLNRAEQARVADYLIVMCYDEHTAGSKKAGPVASLPFVRKGIEDTVRQVGKDATIAAIPFFTRLWQTDGNGTDSRALGMSAAKLRMEELGMTASWDEKTGQEYAKTEANGSVWEIWVEDAKSIGEKMNVIRESGAAGVAAWKLGLETPDIWNVISAKLSS